MAYLLRKYKKELALSLIVACYIAINMLLTFNQIYLFNLLPAILLLAYLAFTRLDIIYFVLIGFTPLSLPLIEFMRQSSIDFYMPTEPMLLGIMLIVIYRSIQKRFLDRRIFSHPVSIAIMINLFWIFFTSVTSSMPLVSFKFLLARLWFLTSFFLLAIYIFKDTRNISRMIWSYVLPFLIVIGYSFTRHYLFGLQDRDAAHWVMNPFYRDHTSYGAVLAMLIFPFVGMNIGLFKQKLATWKLAVLTITFILIIALVLSYTRAAWISVFVSLGVLAIVKLKIKFKYLAIVGIVGLFILFENQHLIVKKFERNEQDSSENLAEHLQSVTNIATDASNLERMNRWACAWRMFQERPILGWGPGTYQFQYAPFQLSRQRTYISTNFADGGNAHSEYIGPLSESGIFGMLTMVLITVMALITAFRVYRRIEDKQLKRIILSLILGFVTYLFHGLLNNFLDTDKVSSLYWGFIAVFVSLDLYSREVKPATNSNS